MLSSKFRRPNLRVRTSKFHLSQLCRFCLLSHILSVLPPGLSNYHPPPAPLVQHIQFLSRIIGVNCVPSQILHSSHFKLLPHPPAVLLNLEPRVLSFSHHPYISIDSHPPRLTIQNLAFPQPGAFASKTLVSPSIHPYLLFLPVQQINVSRPYLHIHNASPLTVSWNLQLRIRCLHHPRLGQHNRLFWVKSCQLSPLRLRNNFTACLLLTFVYHPPLT